MEVKEELNQLEEALENLRGEIKALKILRDGKYLTTVYPEELEGWDIQEWLKERFGGGKYTIQLIKKDGRFGKSFTFLIEGRPKEPLEEKVQDPAVAVLLEQIRELKEELKRRESTDGNILKYLIELEKEQVRQYRELLISLTKQEKREGGLLEKLLQNPQSLVALGTLGKELWKLVGKTFTKKDDLIELVKIAKDDPELKGLIADALSAKYGSGKGLLDALLNNPDLIRRFLSTLEGLLQRRQALPGTISQKETPQPQPQEVQEVEMNPLQVYLKLLNALQEGKSAKEVWETLAEVEKEYLREYLAQTGIETAEELAGVLKASGVPKEYVELIKANKDVVDEFLSLVKAEN